MTFIGKNDVREMKGYHEKKGCRLLAALMVLTVVLGMLPLAGSNTVEAAQPEDAQQKNQVVHEGATLYYSESGALLDGSGGVPDNYAVSVTKTLAQAVDGQGNPLENEFKVDLSVSTKTDYTNMQGGGDSALLIVLDLSSSMESECAECGRKVVPQQGGNIRHPFYAVPAHANALINLGGGNDDIIERPSGGDSTVYYCITDKNGNATTDKFNEEGTAVNIDSPCTLCGKDFYQHKTKGNAITDTEPKWYCETGTDGEWAQTLFNATGEAGANDDALCSACGKTFGQHKLQHKFASRLMKAEQELEQFINAYAKDAGSAKRDLAIISYSGPVSWVKEIKAPTSGPSISTFSQTSGGEKYTMPINANISVPWNNVANGDWQGFAFSDIAYEGYHGSTDTQAGLKLALDMLQGRAWNYEDGSYYSKSTITPEQTAVVWVTDGMPTPTDGDTAYPYPSNYTKKGAAFQNPDYPGDPGNFIDILSAPKGFGMEYKSSGAYLASHAGQMPLFANKDMSIVLKNVANYGYRIRETGASFYTIGFLSGLLEDLYTLSESMEDSFYPYDLLHGYLATFSTQYYKAPASELLGASYQDIIQRMKVTAPNNVKDILPAYLSVTGFNGDSKGAVLGNGSIQWNLSGRAPDGAADKDGRYSYSISYNMKLDTASIDLTGSQPVNKTAPVFSYAVSDGNGAETKGQVAFPVPEVKAFSADFLFTKVDPTGKYIGKVGGEGGTFRLALQDREYTWCETNVTNDNEGKVLFSDLPSGQTYELQETKAPAQPEADGGGDGKLLHARGCAGVCPGGKRLSQGDAYI